MSKNRLFVFISILISLIFVFVWEYTSVNYSNFTERVKVEIDSLYDKVKEILVEKDLRKLSYEVWENGKCVKWVGDSPKVNIFELPREEVFYYENEIAGYFGYREGNTVYYYRILEYDFFTQKKEFDFFEKNIVYRGLTFEYVRYNDYNFQKFLKKKFAERGELNESKGNGKFFTEFIIYSKKGTPLVLVKVRKPFKDELKKVLLLEVLPYFTFYYFFVFLLYLLLFKKIDFNLFFLLGILKFVEILFFSEKPLNYLFPVNSFFSLLSILILIFILNHLLRKENIFYLFSVVYVGFFYYFVFNANIKKEMLIVDIVTISFYISLILLRYLLEKNYKKLLVFVLILSFFNLIFFEIKVRRDENKSLEKYLPILERYSFENLKITKKVIKKLNNITLKDFIKKHSSERLALTLFEKYFLYRIENRNLPSILIYRGDSVLSYFSLSNPLPSFDREVFSKTFYKWTLFTTPIFVRGILINSDVFIKDLKYNSINYRFFILFPQNYYESLTFFLHKEKIKNLFLLRNGETSSIRMIKRGGKYFVIKKGEFFFRGVFLNLGSQQFFLGFPYRDFYYKVVDWLKINFFVFVLLAFLFVYDNKDRLKSFSFRFNFVIILLPILLAVALELSLARYFKNYQYSTARAEWMSQSFSLESMSRLLLNQNFSIEEISFFINRISRKPVGIYRNGKIDFFNGNISGRDFYLPYVVVRKMSGEKKSFFMRKGERFVFFYSINNEIFAVFFPVSKQLDLAFVKFSNTLIFFTFIFTLLIVIFGQLLIKKYNKGLSKIIRGLNKVKSGEFESIEEGDSGEIGELVISFNKMVNNIREQREKIKSLTEKEALLKVARKVAHEIKNPLTPIKLNIDYLFNIRKEDPGEFENSFDKIMKSTKREIENLERVVKDFLNFSKEGIPPLGDIELFSFMESIILLFKGSEVEFNLKGGKVKAIANEAFLETAVKNLIINAIEALEVNRRVDIEIISSENKAEIRIRDYGKGISSEQMDDIFKSGFSTKKGSGLGLSIAKEMIEKMGGELKIISWEGEGTLVIIRLKREVKNE